MDRRVTPPKRVTSPTWGLPPPCKQALKQNSFYEKNNNSARASRFLYISVPSLPNYDVKWPNFELTRERERQGDKFCFLSLNSKVVPSLQF